MPLISKFKSSGNIELLSQKRIAIFSSRNAPREIYPAAMAVFETLSKLPITIGGGWQAPLEKEYLKRLDQKTKADILLYSATEIASRTLTPALSLLKQNDKLLLLSVEEAPERATKRDVDKRDHLLFSQIKQILFLFIAQGGRLEKTFESLLKQGFSPLILEHPSNRLFIDLGGLAVNSDNIVDVLMAHKS